MTDRQITIRNAVLLWLTTAGYMVLIFFLSSREQFIFTLPGNSDKIIHAIAYLPLGLLFYLSLSISGIRKYLLLTASLLAFLYGVSDEVHQFFVPGRDPSFGDILADAVGALTGSLTGNFIKN